MAERRDFERFSVNVRVILSTVDYVSNVVIDAYITDCGKIGAQIVSPVYFKADERIKLKIDMIGGPLEVESKVLECYEDPNQKVRFDKTYVVRVQFDELSENDWQTILALGGR